MKKNRILILLCVALLLAAALTACGNRATGRAEQPSQPAEDEIAAAQDADDEIAAAQNAAFPQLRSFTADTLSGGAFTAADLAQVDLTVINIWSTGCPPCIDEMPDLAAYARTLPDNVRLVTYCIDGESNRQYIQEIMDRAGFAGETLISADGDLAELTRSVMFTPTTLFVDSEGNVVGTPIIGAGGDMAATYTQSINDALQSIGKQAIS